MANPFRRDFLPGGLMPRPKKFASYAAVALPHRESPGTPERGCARESDETIPSRIRVPLRNDRFAPASSHSASDLRRRPTALHCNLGSFTTAAAVNYAH